MQFSINETKALEQVAYGELVVIDEIHIGYASWPSISEREHRQCVNEAKRRPFSNISGIFFIVGTYTPNG